MIELLFAALVFLATLALLIKSADLVIEKTIKIARHFGWTEFAAGFIVIAVATSLPELAVAVIGSLQNAPGIVVGAAIGSNVADLLLVLPILALFLGLWVREKKMLENAQIMFLFTLLLLFVVADGAIGRTEGILLIILFSVYGFFLLKERVSVEISKADHMKKIRDTAILVAGLLVLILSAKFFTDSAVFIAEFFNAPQALIGLTIVAFGTSMPELFVEISAIRKKRYALAFGDLIGSCVTNITLVLGVGALIRPLVFDQMLVTNALFFLLTAVLILNIHLFAHKKIGKPYAIAGFILYALFIAIELGLFALG